MTDRACNVLFLCAGEGQRLAFQTAARHLKNCIDKLLALPVASTDQKRRLEEIGRSAGASNAKETS